MTHCFGRAGRAVFGAALVCALFAIVAPLQAQENDEPSLAEVLREGRARIDLRYRYEWVDQDGIDDRGIASTLRTLLRYESGRYRGFDFVLAAENVSDLGASSLHVDGGFGSFGNGVRGHPAVVDPSFTVLSQGFVRYRNGETTVSAGRQELLFDDQRFVGNVGWRQHHQTYRALQVENRSVAGLTLRYAYVDRVYRVTGARQTGAHHLFHAGWQLPFDASITGYAYLLDFDEAATLSTSTVGAELKGSWRATDRLAVPYELEFAHQSEAAANPDRVSAGYLHVATGLTWDSWGALVGWEQLGGEPGDGRFTTTLATLHAFNGWADKFLATPVTGLEDRYLRVQGPVGPLAVVAAYHDFSSASDEIDYGTEVDFQLQWSAPWEQLFGFRGAFYRAEEFATDTGKLWVYSTYSF